MGVETKKYEYKAIANRVGYDKASNCEDERVLNKMRALRKEIEISNEEKETYMRSKSHFKTVKLRSSRGLNFGANTGIIILVIILSHNR